MKKIFTGLLLLTILAIPTKASAEPLSQGTNFLRLFNEGGSITSPFYFDSQIKPSKPPVIVETDTEPTKPAKPQPVLYTVVSGDNLTKIGTKYKVEWQRIWAKNTEIKHPDRIYVGDQLTIPAKDEVLENRELPVAVSLPVTTPGASDRPASGANYTAGNTYDYGYCTWYVKNKRGATLPNGLGNANTWFSRAQGMGLATGYTPRVGAVGTTTAGSLGHVVYVEAVHGDGTITISEMNYKGWGVQSSRTASASDFAYIY